LSAEQIQTRMRTPPTLSQYVFFAWSISLLLFGRLNPTITAKFRIGDHRAKAKDQLQDQKQTLNSELRKFRQTRDCEIIDFKTSPAFTK
jgi:hypothetical protein